MHPSVTARRPRGGFGSARLRFERRRGCAKLTEPAEVWRVCATGSEVVARAGRGPAWLRRLTGGQESRSSNLLVPTNEDLLLNEMSVAETMVLAWLEIHRKQVIGPILT